MQPVLIVQNIEREKPGLVKAVLEEKNIPIQILIADDMRVSIDLDRYSALIVLGGPASANDDTPVMQREIALARQALAKNKPYLGICLGMQVLAMAAGAQVVKSEVRELGFFAGDEPYVVNHEGQDPLLDGLESPVGVFQLHGETIEVNDRVSVIGLGNVCSAQIIKVGANAYGLQCHFELTRTMLEDWLANDADLQTLEASKVLSDFEELEPKYTQTARTLVNNFLSTSKLIG